VEAEPYSAPAPAPAPVVEAETSSAAAPAAPGAGVGGGSGSVVEGDLAGARDALGADTGAGALGSGLGVNTETANTEATTKSARTGVCSEGVPCTGEITFYAVLPQSLSVMIPWGRARTFSTVPSLVVPQELGLVEVVAVS
jgi:hypothetical protein